jgi:hypothetical protein
MAQQQTTTPENILEELFFIQNIISFEDEPRDASWGERYFHIREPDGYQLSFAMPIKSKA